MLTPANLAAIDEVALPLSSHASPHSAHYWTTTGVENFMYSVALAYPCRVALHAKPCEHRIAANCAGRSEHAVTEPLLPRIRCIVAWSTMRGGRTLTDIRFAEIGGSRYLMPCGQARGSRNARNVGRRRSTAMHCRQLVAPWHPTLRHEQRD